MRKNKDLIIYTKQHFQSYFGAEIADSDAVEMLENFTGFARLLFKLEEKRKIIQEQNKGVQR